MRRIVTVCALALVAVSLTLYQFAPSSAATTINVPAEFSTIQAAIDSAEDGDTVLVAPGTYVENINFNGHEVELASSGGPLVTTIDGGAVAAVVTFESGEGDGAVLRGFTIRNGGEISCGGGGVFIENESAPLVTENIIESNLGGGITLDESSAIIRDNAVRANEQGCYSRGGGILVMGDGSPVIEGNSIIANRARSAGGVALSEADGAVVRNNLMAANRADNPEGSELFVEGSTATISQNLIEGDTSTNGSPAVVWFHGGGQFASNTARGLIFISGGSPMRITNNILTDRDDPLACGGTTGLTLNHNNVFAEDGFFDAQDCESLLALDGNISDDPQFVGGGDYHLQAGSPSIDAGTNSGVTLLATDLDGLPRVVGAAVDQGAYENQIGAVATPTPSPTTTSTATPIPGPYAVFIDCDLSAVGIQSSCDVPIDAGTTSVGVYAVKNTAATEKLWAFSVEVQNHDRTRLDALPSAPCTSPGLNCNPNFNEGLGGTLWSCAPPLPTDDVTPGAIERSRIGCFNLSDQPTLPPTGSFLLTTVSYAIPASAAIGPVELTLHEISAHGESFTELYSCNPQTSSVEALCLGAEIVIVPALGGATATPTPTPLVAVTATPTSAGVGATPTSTPADALFFAVDCDARSPGWQSVCIYSPSAGHSIDVGLVLVNNSGAPMQLGGFSVFLQNPNTSNLQPPFEPPTLEGNPDFNQALLDFTYACSPPFPTADTGSGGPGTSTSYISCISLMAPPLPPGLLELATVRYNIPFGSAGSTTLTPSVTLLNTTFGEIGSCNPLNAVALTCFPATIILEDAPTVTPTTSATASHTPTTTSTSTPTIAVPGVEKVPDGNANNTGLTIPAANLWICETGLCAGPGEGELRVVEHASNVHSDTDADNIPDGSDPCVCTGLGPDNTIGTADDTNAVAPPFTDLGLGAYEFSVEYDNFVIQSVNPCDIVFGTGSPPGAGANRGPVDELNSSAINPDCFNDAGGAAPGSCAFSLILENIVHFGCVSGGQNLGPTGNMDLASLLLIPHPDLNNDLFPGNNNGVLTVLKDNGCELVDTLGHPVHGSVNGGLTPYCRDLAVTVRILEGDLDLDCDVDLTDAQAIASRYGAFFGGLLYSKWYDLEPQFHDLDIDIKDVQKVFGRQDSTCDTPIPAQPPLGPPTAFGD